MKRFSILIICLLGILAIGISVPMVVSADSGWDNDYGGGGGGYSGGSSYSSSYGSSSGSGSVDAAGIITALVIFVAISIRFIIENKADTLRRKGEEEKADRIMRRLHLIDKIVIIILTSILVLTVLAFIIFVTWAAINYPKDALNVFIFISIVPLLAALASYGDMIIKRVSDKIHKFFEYKRMIRKLKKSKKKELDARYNILGLKEEIYKNFVEVQEAWMNFDYDSLIELCGQELYESYKSDLEVLKRVNNKNIMKSFKYHDCYIDNISKKDGNTIIKAILYVSFKDYVINEKTKKTIKGSKRKVFDNIYELEFIRNKKVSIKCPSCGATVEGVECEHCHTVIENYDRGLILISKKLKR